MATLFERALRKFPAKTDRIFAALIVPAAWLLRFYRHIGTERLPRTTGQLRTLGVFPIVHYYYEPLFNPYILTRPLDQDRFLPGLDLRIDAQLELMKALTFADELIAHNWALTSDDPLRYQVDNTYFGPGDADFFYQFLRLTKPRRILEIGSGHSTKVARLAISENAKEGVTTAHRCVEPFENPWLQQIIDIELVRTPIEDYRVDWSTELAAGDLLFIDSSHMIRPQGDVLTEYLEILPQLAPGVFIHIHDIFTPKDYPASWLENDVRFWNEQYLLEALLSNTDRYEVVASLNHLKHHHYDSLHRACPYLTPANEPGSFYIRVRQE